MLILAIETSCDETSAAVVSGKGTRVSVLSNIVSSQIALHQKTGGVVPEVASREHIKAILPVINLSLKEAKSSLAKIDALAVTCGPGLLGSLLVGTNTAKTLAYAFSKPIIPVNHIAGHIYANWIGGVIKGDKGIEEDRRKKPIISRNLPSFPLISLIVSGGHTKLIYMPRHGKYKVIGQTLDDAAGEAFDKVARLLELGYPGGPAIEKAAKKGDPRAFAFPRGMAKSGDFNFSFSGLKTSVLYTTRQLTPDTKQLTKKEINNIAASFQQAVVDVLVGKSLGAIEKFKPKSFLLSGGVAANEALIQVMSSELRARNVNFFHPEKKLCTDNAAMIGAAAYFNQNKKTTWQKINAAANLPLA